MRRPVRSHNNVTDRKLFNNGGFPTMGAQAQMPNPANIQMGGNLPQTNNIAAPSGILASSAPLADQVAETALSQSFAPTVGMNSGGIASFDNGGFGTRFKDFLSGTARAGANWMGIGHSDDTSINPERERYQEMLNNPNPDDETLKAITAYENSLPQVKGTIDSSVFKSFGANMRIGALNEDEKAFSIRTITGPMTTGEWLDETSAITAERIFPSQRNGQDLKSWRQGSQVTDPGVWNTLDRLFEGDPSDSRIKDLLNKSFSFGMSGVQGIKGGGTRILGMVYDVLTERGKIADLPEGKRNLWGQVLIVGDMIRQQPSHSQEITTFAKQIRMNNPGIDPQDLMEQVAVALKTQVLNYDENPNLIDLVKRAEINEAEAEQKALEEEAILEAARNNELTLAESIELSKDSKEIVDLAGGKRTKMEPKAPVELDYERWKNNGFSTKFITEILRDKEGKSEEYIGAVVALRSEASSEGADTDIATEIVTEGPKGEEVKLGTEVFRDTPTSYAVGRQPKVVEVKKEVIDETDGSRKGINIKQNKEDLERIRENLRKIDAKDKEGGQSEKEIENNLGTALADQVIKGDKPETTDDTYKKYFEMFKGSMGEYEGKSEYAKGMDLIALGAAIAGGQSPNAITNIANGITKTIDRFSEDDDKRQAYNNQVRLSAGKFALNRMVKLEDEERARDKTGQMLSQVDKDGNITTKFFTMNQIINGDSEGWNTDTITTSKLTNMGLVAKAALDLIPDPLNWKDATAAQEDGEKAYVTYTTAVKGRLIAMNALSMIHDKKIAEEIFGWRGVVNQLKQKGKAFFNITNKETGELDLTSKVNKELFIGELTNHLTQYFQNLIPLSLGKAQSANSISNRDVEFLAKAYMESGALRDGIFSFAFVNKDLLSQKLRAGLDQFVVSERDALKSFATSYNRLQGLQQTNKTPATELLDQYTVINPKTGVRTMRTKEDDEMLVEAMKKADAATAPFLQFDSKTNTYYDPRTRQK